MNLTSKTVLALNAQWQVADVYTPQKAFCMLMTNVALGVNTTDGSFVPLSWDEWIKLPIVDGEDYAGTTKSKIRVPRVIVAINYERLKVRSIPPSLFNIAAKQGFRCAYTNEKCELEDLSLDHVIPRSRGGGSSWPNLVAASKKANFKKADKTPEEAGMKLLVKHTESPKMQPREYVRFKYGIKHPSWEPFMGKK